jgi:hypothetical protein
MDIQGVEGRRDPDADVAGRADRHAGQAGVEGV